MGLLPKELYPWLIEKFPVFRKLADAEAEVVKAHLRHRQYPKKELLSETVGACSEVHFVVRGTIRVYKTSEEGREITLYRLRAGEMCLFSVSCISGAGELEVSIEAKAGTEVLALAAGVFRELVARNTALSAYLMQRAFSRLNQVMSVVEVVTFVSLKRRVAMFLAQSMELQGSKRLKLTQEEIAFEVGTAREVVSRVLRELEAQRLVLLSRGQVEIVAEDLLAEVEIE